MALVYDAREVDRKVLAILRILSGVEGPLGARIIARALEQGGISLKGYYSISVLLLPVNLDGDPGSIHTGGTARLVCLHIKVIRSVPYSLESNRLFTSVCHNRSGSDVLEPLCGVVHTCSHAGRDRRGRYAQHHYVPCL